MGILLLKQAFRDVEEDRRFFSLTNFELDKRKTEQPTISRDLTKDLLLQFNMGHAWIVERGILSGISGEKQGFEEFGKQEMQARERVRTSE